MKVKRKIRSVFALSLLSILICTNGLKSQAADEKECIYGSYLLEEEEMTISGQKININHYKIENNEDKYVAKFEYKGTLYIFNATTSEQIFNNIIKNIFFP